MLITGNHDYTKVDFPYRNSPIVIEDGAWVGAKAVVAPGVKIASHSILTLGTVITKDTEPYGIYQGNPGVKILPPLFTASMPPFFSLSIVTLYHVAIHKA